MAGDLVLYRPGEEPSATLIAGADGAVPERGDPLEVTGENADGAEVSALSAPANFVATLVDPPANIDEDAVFAAGDVVGEVTIRVTHMIEWFFEDGTNAPAPGDDVVLGADGARPYDPTAGADGGAEDSVNSIVGPCWLTAQKDEGTADKVAVVRQRR